MKRYITRRRYGKGFRYYAENGNVITDKDDLTYYTSLRIPPAWSDVRIAVNKRAKVLAQGVDKAGRTQAIYHPAFRAKQEQAKFERILSFGDALPRLRKQVEADLRTHTLSRDRVLACIVKLIDQAYFRIGNEQYARENQSYGITTLRSKHTTVRGDTIVFDFMGKSGKQHHKVIADRQLARIVKRLDELPGYEVFKYQDEAGNLHDITSADVNEYIKRHAGEDFTAKDFRTWGGTLLATMELIATERAANERERKKIVTHCVKRVAQKLGNTPAVARSSYISPRIIESYLTSDDLLELKNTITHIKPKQYLKPEEQCTLALLRK